MRAAAARRGARLRAQRPHRRVRCGPATATRAEVLADAIERGRAFLDAGAPVVFVPGAARRGAGAWRWSTRSARSGSRCCRSPGAPSLARLEELGVARVSFGPFPQRVALTALQEMVEGVVRGEGIPAGTRTLT